MRYFGTDTEPSVVAQVIQVRSAVCNRDLLHPIAKVQRVRGPVGRRRRLQVPTAAPTSIVGDLYNAHVDALHVGYVKLTPQVPSGHLLLESVSNAQLEAARPHTQLGVTMLPKDQWPVPTGHMVFSATTGSGVFELHLEVEHRNDGKVLLGIALETANGRLSLPPTPAFRVQSALLLLGSPQHGEIMLRGEARPCAATCCIGCFHHRRLFFDMALKVLRQFADEPCSPATSFTLVDLASGFGYRGTRGPFVELTDLRSGAEYSAWLAVPTPAVRGRHSVAFVVSLTCRAADAV